MSQSESALSVFYDRGGDVLYVTRRADRAAKKRRGPDGIFWRYDEQGEAISATVLDYESFWSHHLAQLISNISGKMHVPPLVAQLAVIDAVKDAGK